MVGSLAVAMRAFALGSALSRSSVFASPAIFYTNTFKMALLASLLASAMLRAERPRCPPMSANVRDDRSFLGVIGVNEFAVVSIQI